MVKIDKHHEISTFTVGGMQIMTCTGEMAHVCLSSVQLTLDYHIFTAKCKSD